MIELKDECRNKWRSLLPALGIDGKHLDGKHGPCPLCGGRDRFRFDDKDGRGTFFCSGCGAGDGLSLLMKKHGWSFKELAAELRPHLGTAVEERPNQKRLRDPIADCRQLWDSSRSLAAGDPVARYLGARRLPLPDAPSLRFVSGCRVTGVAGVSRLPAMIAKVTAPDGAGASVHRTYLGDGAKADIDSPKRIMPGAVPKGSAIRLFAHQGVLAVAEGIETALAVWRDFGLPCWSLLNATMMREFVWPDDITELHIFGDNDTNFAGQVAAYHLGNRAMVAARPLPTEIHIPPTPGEDWLDHGNARLACAA